MVNKRLQFNLRTNWNIIVLANVNHMRNTGCATISLYA